MAYKCLECGHIFERGEERFVSEDLGEFWGAPVSVEIPVCPICGEGYEETVRCANCESEQFAEDLVGGVCEECADLLIFTHKYDIEKCFNFTSDEKTPVGINSFLASMFTVNEIEEILLKELHIASCTKPVDCSSFINEDRGWFIEKLLEEDKKNED